MEELQTNVASLTVSANILWVLIAGFMVFFMQAGFALVETGFTRSKNVAHTMLMNMMVFMDTAATIPTGSGAERIKFMCLCHSYFSRCHWLDWGCSGISGQERLSSLLGASKIIGIFRSAD
jgi:hypothetical protein